MIATAAELFDARHYPSVIAVATDALDQEPECVPLLLIRARSHIALRRDLDAQADLRDIIRLDPACGLAFRLLGELAARRDENDAAAIFFREALRLEPTDPEAADWLLICDRPSPSTMSRSAAVAPKLPTPRLGGSEAGRWAGVLAGEAERSEAYRGPATAAGRFPPLGGPVQRARTATDEVSLRSRTISSPHRADRPSAQRVARGTAPPTAETALASPPHDAGISSPASPTVIAPPNSPMWIARPQQASPELQGASPFARGSSSSSAFATAPLPPRPSIDRPRAPEPKPEPTPMLLIQPRAASHMRPMPRSQIREMPGFGDYLVATGILSRERLRAAQAYQRSMKVQLSTAIVTLGLATPQRIEWAAVAHQSELGRDRRA